VSKVKILAVDDELHIRRLLEMLLKSAGFDVRTASDGEQGLEAALSFRPALIISDYKMPGKMNGIEMIYTLRNEEFGKEIPVILLTGSVSIASSLCKTIEALTKVIHVTKPFSPRKLVLLVQETIKDIEPTT